MAEYDTIPQEADDRQDTLEESGVVAGRTGVEEDAPQESPPDRQNQRLCACKDVGCTWPCAHHFHWRKRPKDNLFLWYPDLDRVGYQHPEISRIQSEMKVGTKDCQFGGIFFSIGGVIVPAE